MSQNLAPPPPGPTQPKPRRRFLPRFSDKPETRAVQIGVLGTLLIHLLLLLVAPHVLRMDRSRPGARKHVPRQFNIEIAPDVVKRKPLPKPPMKFVEANPNAPENVPDKTNNFSDRNQQVAQEKPTHGKSDMPTTQGRKDIQSTQIVDGSLAKPQQSTPAPLPTPPKAAANATPRQAQNPLAGFDKAQGNDKNGTASNIGKPAANQKPIPEKVDGAKQGPLVADAFTGAPQIDPKHPQPRRVLERRVRPAVFAQNTVGTSNIGLQAVDAKWSNYGVYLQRLVETVQIEWDSILEASSLAPPSGSLVTVKFVLNSKGEIAKIVSVDPSDGTPQSAQDACVAGITARQPYGPWTDDMIAVLGTESTMTFTFLYQ